MSEHSITVSDLLPYIGEFGLFQCVQQVFLSFILVALTMPIYVIYFASLDSPWRCVSNSTICNLNGTFSSGETHYQARCDMPRDEWEFTQPKQYSVVTEFDLYCQSSWKTQLTVSSFYLGWFVGGFVVGGLADRFGRRKVLLVCTAWHIFGNFLCAFSPNIWFLICVRFFLGFSIPGGSLQASILIAEMLGSKHRAIASSIFWQFYNVASLLLDLTAYNVREWKMLFILTSVPYVFVIGFFPFLAESMQWLHVKGKNKEAMMIAKKIAKYNKKSIPKRMNLSQVEKSTSFKNPTPIDLFRTKQNACKIATLGYAWMALNMIYYALSLASGDFGGDLYMNFLLVSLMEVPANIISGFTMKWIGRKKTVVPSCFLACVASLLLAFIPSKGDWAVSRVLVGMIGKLFASLGYNSIYLWSAELYPTRIRSTATSFMQALAPIGGTSAPWIASYLKELHPSAPFATMGAITFLSGVLLLRLPETKDAVQKEISPDDQELMDTCNEG